MAFGIILLQKVLLQLQKIRLLAVTGQELTIAETSPGVIIDVTVSLTGQD
jgi:hypothetical protein